MKNVQLCNHLLEWNDKKEGGTICEECVKINSHWVHLRTCQICGVTLCCDSSPNQHASAHARESGHAIVISAEPGEQWAWCYIHQQIIRY